MKNSSKIWMGIFAGITLISIAVCIRLTMVNDELTEKNINQSQYEIQLENLYEKSYFELTDSMRNMEVALSKLTVTNSLKQREMLLMNIAALAETAQSDLSTMPLENDVIKSSLTFANRTGDFCKSLQKKITNGKNLSASDKEGITSLTKTSRKLSAKLNEMSSSVGNKIKFTDSIKGTGKLEGMTDNFKELNENTFNYPELIYDGPFSEAKQKSININMPEMSAEKVEAKLKKDLALLNVTSIKKIGELSNKINVYNFEVETNGKTLYVQASKNGGMVTLISSMGEHDKKAAIDTKTAEKKAKEFAMALGFDVEPVWVSKNDEGCTYVNLATVINDVIVYPDLVKVSIDSKGVCGFESFNYLANHKERKIGKVVMNEAKAKTNLTEGLVVKGTNMALIPKDGAELLCYELECEMDGNQYFMFVDVKTNEEADLFKVIKGTEGYTVM